LICWKKSLIGEYGGFRSEFDPYTDRNAYQIPIKFSYQIHIKLRSVCLVGNESVVQEIKENFLTHKGLDQVLILALGDNNLRPN
jgi:hypothetical protein